ncbi:IS110 family transposase [Microbacterium sp. B2969]|uniref:IS110 family transposase n=1 Tax=Microbacterium alkaliflavum TaxID=3248839 RepID=A0ABW7Q3S7_9MICO
MASIIIGVDPHRKVLTAAVLDESGRDLDHQHFANSRRGHEDALAWALTIGSIRRVGIEGASGLGRPLAEFLIEQGLDVRDVPPHKTAQQQRGRYEGKTDRLDAHRVAVETQTNDRLAHAFKSSTAAPDALRDQLALWHNARISLRKIRVQLIGELDALIHDLPELVRARLPERVTARARITAIAKLRRVRITDPVQQLRLTLIRHRVAMLKDVLDQDKAAAAELAKLVGATGSTLPSIPGIAARSAAEILLEVGDPRRFTEAGFARFNGTAPIPVSSGEAGGRPRRYRLSRGGNRRLNAAIHRAATTQLRCEPRARELYEAALSRGHTRREAMRILKRHLSNTIHRTMIRDANQPPLLT